MNETRTRLVMVDYSCSFLRPLHWHSVKLEEMSWEGIAYDSSGQIHDAKCGLNFQS
jgi:hypothetical protein